MDYDNDNAASEMDGNAPSPVTFVDINPNSWDPQCIEREIVKGQELCKLKRRQCDVFRPPPCPASGRQDRYKPVPPCQISSPYNEKLQAYFMPPAPPTRHTKGSRRRKCPLRIMELATPSKRLCIETWRTMKDVLPDFMVERLRNLIMDEKILVGIPEAITTFKRKSPGVNKRSKKPTKSKTKTTKDMEQIKMISALFGSKLVGKLYKPKTTKLNPKLEKISKIVNKDVQDLIKKRNAILSKNTQNEDLLNEVSDRVAIWISLILQDASYKLLEEELKELEQQEGPVLDILDQLVNDVLENTEPYPPEEQRGDTSGEEHFESVSEGGKSDRSTENQFQDSFSSPEEIDKADAEAAETQEIEPDQSSPEDFDEIALQSSETEKVEIKSDVVSADDIDKSALEASQTQKQEIGDVDVDALEASQTQKQEIDDVDVVKIEDAIEQMSEPTEHIDTTIKSDNMEEEVFDNKVEEQSLTSSLVPELDTIDKSPVDMNEINESSKAVDKTNELSEEKSIKNIASDTNVENTVPPEEDSSFQADVSSLNKTDKVHTILDNESDLNTFENKIKPGQDETVAKDDEVDNKDTKVENTVPPEEDSSFQTDVSSLNKTDKVHTILDDESDINRFENKIKPGQEVTVAKDDKVHSKDEESNLDSSHTPQLHIEEFVDRKVTFTDSDIGRQLKIMKPDLILGPVNEDLLCNADESWPEKFIPLRPAASVTKSMESLGKIKESDETQLTLQNEERDKTLQFKNKVDQSHIRDKSKGLETELNKDVIPQEHSRKIRSNDSIEISDTHYDGIDLLSPHEPSALRSKDDHRHADDAKKYEAMIQKDESSVKTKKPKFDSSMGKTIYTDEDTGDAKKYGGKHYAEEFLVPEAQKYETMTPKDKLSFKTKPSKSDYKVCLVTAPSWVKQGHGEPSIDDLITRIKVRQKYKKCCLQNWVTELHNVTTKLEKWNQWIDTASFNVVYLKNNRNVKHCGRRCHREIQDWVKLHKSVDNDALLWTKLYQKQRVKLQRNKEIPKKIKCDCMRYQI